ncbi:MAG: ABC transporter permease [Anaerolineae bacterium]
MQKIFQIAQRDIKLEFSSPMAWLTFLILPVVFTAIFAGQISGGGDGSTPGLTMLLVDEDQTDLSADLVAGLTSSPSVSPEIVTLADADERYLDGALAVLHIPAGFEQSVLNAQSIELDLRIQPSNTSGQIVNQAVQLAVSELVGPLQIAADSTAKMAAEGQFDSQAEQDAWFQSIRERAAEKLTGQPDRVALTQPAEADASGFDVQSQQALGQLITWVFIPLIGVSVLFVSERQYGTLSRMLTTPTSKATYMGGVIFGQLSKGLVQMLLLVLFGGLVYGIAYGRSPAGLAMVLFSFGLAAVALGTMLGTFVKSDGQANGLSIMLGMVLALLGGCWYPLEFFPPAAKFVANFTPTSWALRGMTDLVVRGDSWVGVLPETGVLFLFAAVFFGIGVWRFRYE